MTQCSGLVATHQPEEIVALDLESILERQRSRGLDAFDNGLRRNLSTGLLAQELTRAVEHACLILGHCLLRGSSRPGVRGQQFPHPGHGAFFQVTVDYFVHESKRLCLCCGDRRPGGHELEGCFDTRKARRPLRAPGPGQQSELHFRQPDPGTGDGAAIVCRQRHFKAATERRPVDGGDHGFGRCLNPVDDVGQHWLLHRLAELGDVRAGNERPSGTDDQDSPRVVTVGEVQRVHEALPHGMRQRIYRRIIDAYDANLVRKCVIDRGCHAGLLCK